MFAVPANEPHHHHRSLGEEIVTLREVVSEIRDKATRQRLQVLPYELTFKEADPDDIRHGMLHTAL